MWTNSWAARVGSDQAQWDYVTPERVGPLVPMGVRADARFEHGHLVERSEEASA